MMKGMMSAVVVGAPAPLAHNTQDDSGLPPPIPYVPSTAASSSPRALFDLVPASLDWASAEGMAEGSPLQSFTRAIRPICVGALLAIPTLGPATVGVVAFFDRERALAMVAASTAFLAGIPGDIVLLIGALATGYGVARTIEKKASASGS